MGIKSDLNVAPYHDDFAEDSKFYRVLFRPGYSIQARELTTLQTMLQTQVERFGRHMFKENSMVIPGQVALDKEYTAVKINSVFTYLDGQNVSQSTEPNGYASEYVGSTITGGTSGVEAKVINSVQLTPSDPITLYVKYSKTGSSGESVFQDAENISADKLISIFAVNAASATTKITDATATGSAASIGAGVYFVRGHFVQNIEATLILDKYTNTPSYRVGFSLEEILETPENDTSLLDNSTGSTNFSSKGAHRLKLELVFSKLEITSLKDNNFVELLRIENGRIVEKINRTDYALMAKTMARRTYDESGDYTLGRYKFDIREHNNDGYNGGIYVGGDESKAVVIVSPGKSYVKGFEVQNINPKFVSINKARNFASKQNFPVHTKFGNYLSVDNVWGMPDISNVPGGNGPYNKVELRSRKTLTTSVAAGDLIGHARIKAFDNLGIAHTTTTEHNVYLFDVQMLTTLGLQFSSAYTTGAKITGSVSGAWGYVFSGGTGLGTVDLHGGSGTFLAVDNLISSISSDTQTNNVIISDTVYWDISDTKQLFSDISGATTFDFTADALPNAGKILTGKLSFPDIVAGTFSVPKPCTGVGTYFTQELKSGDIIRLIDYGVLKEVIVVDVTSDIAFTYEGPYNVGTFTVNALSSTSSVSPYTVACERVRTRLVVGDQNTSLFPLPKKNIKSLLIAPNYTSDLTLEVKRQYLVPSSPTGIINVTAGVNETFTSYNARDYILCLEDITNAPYADYVTVPSGNVTGTGTGTLTISGVTASRNYKLIATIKKSIGQHRTKTLVKSVEKIILSATTTDPYGTRVGDDTIGLGQTDVFKIRAIYQSSSISNTPESPTIEISSLSGPTSGTIVAGDKFIGVDSSAIGVVISYDTTSKIIKYYSTFSTFTNGEGITYGDANTATISALTVGDNNIISDYTLDNGQRPSFYDVSRISRKLKGSVPNEHRLLIIFDYFTHSSTGDYFSVDSYVNQIDRADIPKQPIGFNSYSLADVLDFRGSITLPVTPVNAFTFHNRGFSGTPDVFDDPKLNHTIITDFDYYLSRVDHLYLSSNGSFVIQSGVDAEIPSAPPILANSMKIAALIIPAFTSDVGNIRVSRIDNTRYTMRDIGEISKRIDRLEYYTSLSMLESSTQNMQIFDGNGFDRFKSGFVIDNFSNFSTGQWNHIDCNASIDPGIGVLRPSIAIFDWELREYIDDASYMKWLQSGLSSAEKATAKGIADTSRSGNNYQKTGPLITLPYEDVIFTSQSYASHVENVNPYAIQVWTAGTVKLDPPGDTWVDTVMSDNVSETVDGPNLGALKDTAAVMESVYGSWNIDSVTTSPEVTTVESLGGTSWEELLEFSGGEEFTDPGTGHISWDWIATLDEDQLTAGAALIADQQNIIDVLEANPNAFDDLVAAGEHLVIEEDMPGVNFSNFIPANMKVMTNDILTTTTTETQTNLSRSVHNFVVQEEIVKNFTGVTRSEEPLFKIRSKRITLVASNMKPDTRIYPFFDDRNIAVNCKNEDDTPGPFTTDSSGEWIGTFNLPGGSFDTGNTTFRLTDSPNNVNIQGIVKTSAEGIYSTQGTRVEEQYNYTSTRNGVMVAVPGEPEFDTTIDFTSESVESQEWVRNPDTGKLIYIDPLAQTFVVGNNSPGGAGIDSGRGGIFVTKVDLYFQSKDAALPVIVSIRNVLNGYPTTEVLPFAEATLKPADINLSEDGTTATSFVFESPVHLREGFEYCVVIISNSNEYNCWVSKLGEKDIVSERSISENPHLGVFFKSQNASTWTADQTQDLKFDLYKAQFNTASSGLIRLKNKVLENAFRVVPDGLEFRNGTTLVKVHKKNHGFSKALNNHSVKISIAAEYPVGSGTICGVPLTEINKTHTTISDIELDSFTIVVTTSATMTTRAGGKFMRISRNIPYEIIRPSVRVIDFEETTIGATITTTRAGYTNSTGLKIEDPYVKNSSAVVELNKDYLTPSPSILTSASNQSVAMNGIESLNLDISFTSTNPNISPVLDTDFMSCHTVSHRINSVNSSSNTGTMTEYKPSTEASGDNNAAIYMTREIRLEVPATALRTMFAGVVEDECDIEVLYKTLPEGSEEIFSNIGWEFYNFDGSRSVPDISIPDSNNGSEFYDRLYTQNDLPEFSSFAIKIVMKSTNITKTPKIRDFRTIAMV